MARLPYYPKLVVILETTESERVIKEAFDAFYAGAQALIRAIIADIPNTTIIKDEPAWHYHKSDGSRDEVEP